MRTRGGDRDDGAGASGEEGVATVWGALAAAALLALAGALWLVGHVVAVRHHTTNAADLAALAAAGRADRGVEAACAHATRVADRMEVDLVECGLHTHRSSGSPDVLVRVENAGPAALGALGPVAARARAGPVDTDR